MSKISIYLIGIGDCGWKGLASSTQDIILCCRSVFGGKRHINMLPAAAQGLSLHTWKTPLKDSLADLAHASVQNPFAVLASGDPMWHGIGKLLYRHFPQDSISTIPAVGSFSLCCARLGWQMEDVSTLSLHHRPCSFLLRHLGLNQKILLLTRNADSLTEIAQLLAKTPYKNITMHVLEHLGGPQEKISTGTPRQYAEKSPHVAALYCIALVVPPKLDETVLPFLGLPDTQLFHDGVMTKSRIRVITIADLAPRKHALLWDVGAGCGSVSIEWMRLGGRAYAIEQNTKRIEMLRQNVEKFGLDDLIIVNGSAPDVCADLPSPDAIFIGGGMANNPNLFDFCYNHLHAGGRIVINAVTLESEKILLNIYAKYGGSLSRIALSEACKVGASQLHGWQASMPITHYVLEKS